VGLADEWRSHHGREEEEATPGAEKSDAITENSRNLPHQFSLWMQKLLKLPSLPHNSPHYEKKPRHYEKKPP
jgi:hypothetical protein